MSDTHHEDCPNCGANLTTTRAACNFCRMCGWRPTATCISDPPPTRGFHPRIIRAYNRRWRPGRLRRLWRWAWWKLTGRRLSTMEEEVARVFRLDRRLLATLPPPKRVECIGPMGTWVSLDDALAAWKKSDDP